MKHFHFLKHDRVAVGPRVPRKFHPANLRPGLFGVDLVVFRTGFGF
jgi:hypothetical protein